MISRSEGMGGGGEGVECGGEGVLEGWQGGGGGGGGGVLQDGVINSATETVCEVSAMQAGSEGDDSDAFI